MNFAVQQSWINEIVGQPDFPISQLLVITIGYKSFVHPFHEPCNYVLVMLNKDHLNVPGHDHW